jgi:hypothetical protein
MAIKVDLTSIRHDFDRGGTRFVFTDGLNRYRVLVDDEAISDHLRTSGLTPAQSESFVRQEAMPIALRLAERTGGRPVDGELLVRQDLL